MATWRCAHCGTAQAESTRCFLCGRSATSCGTCVHFRGSVVGGVGFCGLDKTKSPLSGAEQRSCWTGPEAYATEGLFAAPRLPVIERQGDPLSAAPVISARSETG